MKSNLLIIILVITTLTLGVFIINPSGLKSPSFENKASKSEARLIPADLSEEEKKLLTVPSPDASKEEINAHIALGANLAKEADILEISDCKPKPLVLRVKEKAMFKVSNKDDTNYTLIIDEEHKYTISAKETTEIKADFGKPPGLYGYVCEGVGLTGFIFVY